MDSDSHNPRRPRRRLLLVTNLAALLLLAAVLVAGWWDAAAFGLAVLLVMDVIVLVRERLSRHDVDQGET